MKQRTMLGRKKWPCWELRLYVADSSPRSVLAIGNLRKICAQHLKTNYRITIIDIARQPALARARNILATPMLLRVRRPRDTTIIGTLADTPKVLRALGVSVDNEPQTSTFAPGFAQIGHA